MVFTNYKKGGFKGRAKHIFSSVGSVPSAH